MNSAETTIKDLLLTADIRCDGQRAWDLDVRDSRFFDRILRDGSIGLGESYMDGWWDCRALDDLCNRILSADLASRARRSPGLATLSVASHLRAVLNPGSRIGMIGKHYDTGNDLFECMLDSKMMYSCAYWKTARNLEEAQIEKLELACDKLEIKSTHRVLDIGCGWGGFCIHAAQAHGVSAVGVTISAQQAELAARRAEGLPVTIERKDYRKIEGKFDRIASFGMFEHVHRVDYRIFFRKAHSLLSTNGLFLLHTIVNNGKGTRPDPWLQKYIFPDTLTPSPSHLTEAMDDLFVVEDVHNIGPHYDPTCMAWGDRFLEAWPKLSARYDERFKRLWIYYLRMAAGTFRSRTSQVFQLVLAPKTRRARWTFR